MHPPETAKPLKGEPYMKKKIKRNALVSVLFAFVLILSLPATSLAADAPVLNSAVVTPGGDVVLTFSKAMASPPAGAAGFTVNGTAGISKTVQSATLVSLDNTKILLTLATKIYGGETPHAGYTPGTVVSGDGETLAEFYVEVNNPLPHPVMDATPLPAGTVGVPYSYTFTATGGTTPYYYKKYYGTLPNGLTLSNSGILSGTPTTAGTYGGSGNLRISVSDANEAFDILDITLTIKAPELATTVTNEATGITVSGATLSGNVTNDGGPAVSERGFVYGASANPAIGGAGVTKAAAGSGTGSFTAAISGLPANTACHVRAYAINTVGTAYGEDKTFTTLATVPAGISCQKTDSTAYGACDGSITITASGGNSGTYQYSIDAVNWQNGNTFGNLGAGTYTAMVRDAGNPTNTATMTVTISQPGLSGNYPAKKMPAKAHTGTAIHVNAPLTPKGYALVSLSFTTSNQGIAKADGTGNITFLAGGKVTITIKATFQTMDRKGNVKTKTTTIRKTITVNQPVASITFDNNNISITKTQKTALKPTVSPTTASNKRLKWTSSNPKVASVSSSGVVTGKAAGAAIITCKAKDSSGVSASCTVTVTPLQPTGVKLSKTVLQLKTGKSRSLKATVSPSKTDFKTVVWTSSNTSVATVSNGRITGISAGTAIITATTSNGLTAACTVMVK